MLHSILNVSEKRYFELSTHSMSIMTRNIDKPVFVGLHLPRPMGIMHCTQKTHEKGRGCMGKWWKGGYGAGGRGQGKGCWSALYMGRGSVILKIMHSSKLTLFHVTKLGN